MFDKQDLKQKEEELKLMNDQKHKEDLDELKEQFINQSKSIS